MTEKTEEAMLYVRVWEALNGKDVLHTMFEKIMEDIREIGSEDDLQILFTVAKRDEELDSDSALHEVDLELPAL